MNINGIVNIDFEDIINIVNKMEILIFIYDQD